MTLPKQLNFRKTCKGTGGGEGGLFSIQKFMLQILDLYAGLFEHEIGKNLQHDFPKMRRGVKGRLELFQKFIRFGGITPSLMEGSDGRVLPLPRFVDDRHL